MGVPERSAGDYLHLSCRINSTSEEMEQEEQEGHGVHALGGQPEDMSRVMTSPNYPRNYPNRSECLEVIAGQYTDEIR